MSAGADPLSPVSARRRVHDLRRDLRRRCGRPRPAGRISPAQRVRVERGLGLAAVLGVVLACGVLVFAVGEPVTAALLAGVGAASFAARCGLPGEGRSTIYGRRPGFRRPVRPA